MTKVDALIDSGIRRESIAMRKTRRKGYAFPLPLNNNGWKIQSNLAEDEKKLLPHLSVGRYSATEQGQPATTRPAAFTSNNTPPSSQLQRSLLKGNSLVRPHFEEEHSDNANSKNSAPSKSFPVTYLGDRDASGLWGINHTRQAVDEMLALSEAMRRTNLHRREAGLTLEVTSFGLKLKKELNSDNLISIADDDDGGGGADGSEPIFFCIREISYGVQDPVHPTVFAMIVVREGDMRRVHPFKCHAFSCESKEAARRLTYALAAAFEEYGRRLKEEISKMDAGSPLEAGTKNASDICRRGGATAFAIDLRSPDEIRAEMLGCPGPAADSEA